MHQTRVAGRALHPAAHQGRPGTACAPASRPSAARTLACGASSSQELSDESSEPAMEATRVVSRGGDPEGRHFWSLTCGKRGEGRWEGGRWVLSAAQVGGWSRVGEGQRLKVGWCKPPAGKRGPMRAVRVEESTTRAGHQSSCGGCTGGAAGPARCARCVPHLLRDLELGPARLLGRAGVGLAGGAALLVQPVRGGVA